MDQALPLQDLFDLMEVHFGLRHAEKKLLKYLEQRTVQFRMI